MLQLLRQCVDEDHGESWCEFWILIESVASQPVRKLLRRFGVDSMQAEDVIQEIFLMLQEDEMKKLRSFRGNSRAQLAAWLKCLAVNYTLNWLDMYCRQRKHEETAVAQLNCDDAYHPEEMELFELLHDLKADLNSREIERLELLAGIKTPPKPIPKRTLRRWQQQLRTKRKYL